MTTALMGPNAGLGARLGARLRTLAAAASLVLLAACGPGEGGTGTGSVTGQAALAAFGAQAASVCTGAQAAALACVLSPGSGSSSGVTPPPGTATVVLANSANADASVSAVLNGNEIDLVARCANVDFVGAWGQRPGEEPRYFGSMLRPGSLQREWAALTFVTDAQLRATLVLRDANGNLVLGPLVLQRVAATPSLPPRC